MPRKAEPPRLLLRQRSGRKPTYVIKDREHEVSTGFGPERREEAEKRLADYITEKWEAPDRASQSEMTIADVLTAFAVEHAPSLADPARVGYAIEALIPYWGDKTVSKINGKACRDYADKRPVTDGTVRRELGVLRAALNYCAGEGYLRSAPVVKLPPRPPARERWLTRSEVARLLNAARQSRKTRHVAKFILVAVYTGTRKSAILNLGWEPSEDNGHVDLVRGLLYRSGSKERQTKKRRTPAKLPRQLLMHLRLWRKNSPNHVVHFNGEKVRDIKTAWDRLCKDAGLEDVNRHSLKHTAITWAMQNGADTAHAASFFATTMDTIERVYLHHHPDFQQSAVGAMERRT